MIKSSKSVFASAGRLALPTLDGGFYLTRRAINLANEESQAAVAAAMIISTKRGASARKAPDALAI